MSNEIDLKAGILHLDTYNGRLVFTTDCYMGSVVGAEEGDEDIIAIYDVDPGWLLSGLLDEFAAMGVDVDAMLRRREADPDARLLPSGMGRASDH
jgi:hypothetical protein